MLVIPISQLASPQTIENEIMENTLETVEKATAGIPEIAPPVNETSRSIEISTLNITEPIPDNFSQLPRGNESAVAGVGDTTDELTAGTESAVANITEDVQQKIEEAKSDTESAVTNATEDVQQKIQEARSDIESSVINMTGTAQPAQETAQPAQETAPAENTTENGGNILEDIWGQITGLFK
ncbi:MAG TPA: hypothetical protein VFV86_07405 [Nitrososphaeraceae archaeon]|nr:hypothetical protein [Nitrososphaeraceae archaeon]